MVVLSFLQDIIFGRCDGEEPGHEVVEVGKFLFQFDKADDFNVINFDFLDEVKFNLRANAPCKQSVLVVLLFDFKTDGVEVVVFCDNCFHCCEILIIRCCIFGCALL